MTSRYRRKVTREGFSEKVTFETGRIKGYVRIYMADAQVDCRLDLY